MYCYACKTGINGVLNHDLVYTNWVEYCPFPKKVPIFKIEVFATVLLAIHWIKIIKKCLWWQPVTVNCIIKCTTKCWCNICAIYSERQVIMKRKFKRWWSPRLPTSTKRTITSHLTWTHSTQKHDRDIWRWNSGPSTKMWRG